jgi:transcription antitermination factor NusG
MPLENPHYQWYAIYTRANDEKKLFNSLREKNIECYLPTRKVRKDWIDRKKWIEEPMFRSYLFVRVSYLEFFQALNTPGVVCFISAGGKAQAIPEVQINNIKTFLDQADHEVSISYEHIDKGRIVEVTNGSLQGIHGEVVIINGQTRLLTRLDSLRCCLYTNLTEKEAFMFEEKPVHKETVFLKRYAWQNN